MDTPCNPRICIELQKWVGCFVFWQMSSGPAIFGGGRDNTQGFSTELEEDL